MVLTSTNSSIRLAIDAKVADRPNVWIDLNGNDKKDNGEKVTVFGKSKFQNYTKTANTITIYGKVEKLRCNNNNLSYLDISQNILLTNLSCFSNKLTTLKIGENTKLEGLACRDNQLTNLDVGKCTELARLWCYNNKLSTLNVSENKKLVYLDCGDNPNLIKLNVANGNNKNFKYERGAFDATGCPNLECIKVDLGFKPDNQTETKKKWIKDDTANWNNTDQSCENFDAPMYLTSKYSSLEFQIDAATADRKNVWIDLNGNYKKDSGEKITNFHTGSNIHLTKTRKTVAIYGKTTFLYCPDNSLTRIDVTRIRTLKQLRCWDNKLTTLDVSKNTVLKTLMCKQNPLSCIKVNQTQYNNIPSGWEKPNGANYSTTCGD